MNLGAPFNLGEGVSASIVGLEDSSVTRVAKACQCPNFFGYSSKWLVLTIRIRSEKVHLLFHCSHVNLRRSYALIIKQTLMHKYWKILRNEASFAVYRDVLYKFNVALFASFEYAIQNKVSPAIAVLTHPQKQETH